MTSHRWKQHDGQNGKIHTRPHQSLCDLYLYLLLSRSILGAGERERAADTRDTRWACMNVIVSRNATRLLFAVMVFAVRDPRLEQHIT